MTDLTKRDQDADLDITRMLERVALLQAHQLVLQGEPDQAEALLCPGGKLPSTADALDLLARIVVQKGDFQRARQLWKSALELDPASVSAKTALARLDSPWLAAAVMKRIAMLSGLAVLLGLSVVGVFTLLYGVQYSEPLVPEMLAIPEPRTKPVTAPSPIIDPDMIVQPPTVKAAEADETHPVETAKAPAHASPPFFSIPGCSVSTNVTETRIVFDEGLFVRLCELSEAAQQRLAGVGEALAKNATDCWTIVEGHTDSDPMSPSSVYRDNYALGFQRAVTVAEALRTTAGSRAERILVASAGDTAPPFRGEDSEQKKRNRTVVIRLVPIDGESFGTGKGSNEFAR